jgi:hypothetical protein
LQIRFYDFLCIGTVENPLLQQSRGQYVDCLCFSTRQTACLLLGITAQTMAKTARPEHWPVLVQEAREILDIFPLWQMEVFPATRSNHRQIS